MHDGGREGWGSLGDVEKGGGTGEGKGDGDGVVAGGFEFEVWVGRSWWREEEAGSWDCGLSSERGFAFYL